MFGSVDRLLRRLLLRWSQGVVLWRRMPSDFGGARIAVSPSVSLRYWYRNSRHFDSSLLDAAREFVAKGACVWDIGASVGLFTVASAFRSGPDGHVLAMEPDAWVADLLMRTAQRRPPDHAAISVLQAAASEESGMAELAIGTWGRATSHLVGVRGSSFAGRVPLRQEVSALALDELLVTYPAPDVLKIDVEGSEELVLRGAGSVLSKGPIVLCEVHEHNAEAVGQILCEKGYELFDLDDRARPRRSIARAAFNTLALMKPEPRREVPDFCS